MKFIIYLLASSLVSGINLEAMQKRTYPLERSHRKTKKARPARPTIKTENDEVYYIEKIKSELDNDSFGHKDHESPALSNTPPLAVATIPSQAAFSSSSQLASSFIIGQMLIAAAENNQIDRVKQLLQMPGININARNQADWTALMCAAYKGHTNIVRALLDIPGNNSNVADEFGYTALILAAAYGHKEIVELLLAKPNINIQDETVDGLTAFRLAEFGNHSDITELLMEHEVRYRRRTNKVNANTIVETTNSRRSQAQRQKAATVKN